jgi:hypothetical protein
MIMRCVSVVIALLTGQVLAAAHAPEGEGAATPSLELLEFLGEFVETVDGQWLGPADLEELSTAPGTLSDQQKGTPR